MIDTTTLKEDTAHECNKQQNADMLKKVKYREQNNKRDKENKNG